MFLLLPHPQNNFRIYKRTNLFNTTKCWGNSFLIPQELDALVELDTLPNNYLAFRKPFPRWRFRGGGNPWYAYIIVYDSGEIVIIGPDYVDLKWTGKLDDLVSAESVFKNQNWAHWFWNSRTRELYSSNQWAM